MMLSILPIPILSDNYVWLIHDGQAAVVVDPGVAAPVQARLDQLGLHLAAILLTHHHQDHTAGVNSLRTHNLCPVYGPASLDLVERPLFDQDPLHLAAPHLELKVMAVPGHTLDHLAYYNDTMLFCGDTLFACGCGRLFEGSPAQMLASLQRLSALPAATAVYCTHEYTLANQAFARMVEPNNAQLIECSREDASKRAKGQPTLPSSIGRERACNPFLRYAETSVIAAAAARGADPADPLSVFTSLRRWKDDFRAP